MTATQQPVTPADLVSHFRMMAHQYFPYLSPYVYSLVPVERPGLGTMAVDMQGRMYYDPDFCEKLTLNQGAYVVLHEAWHLILRHCHRAESIIGKSPTAQQRRWYNIAVDLVVWELMTPMAEFAPGNCVTWKKLKDAYPALQPNMLPGEIYAIIAGQQECPPQDPPVHKQEEEQDEDEQPEQQEEDESEDDESGEDAECHVRSRSKDEGQDDDGRSESDASGGDQEGDGQGTGPSREGDEAGDSAGPGEEVADDGFDLIGGGSAADGQQRDYEEEPNPNWDAFIEDQLLEAVEKKVEEQEREWSSSRGTIPGCLKDTIRRKLRPQPNPWDMLRASVARAALNPRGAKDYTYQRVNRRQFAIPNAPRLKGSNQWAPKAVVVIDTSGSMTTACKRKCIEVMAQGLQAVGDFRVVFGDTRVHADVRWTAMKDEVEMPGGGGTDMRVLLDYAEKTHKPDVIVIGTDGGTPWPDRPTKAQLVVALTQELPTPAWATRVRIPDNPKKDEV